MEKSWGEGSSGREEGREAGMEEARGPKYLKGGGVRGRKERHTGHPTALCLWTIRLQPEKQPFGRRR